MWRHAMEIGQAGQDVGRKLFCVDARGMADKIKAVLG